MPEPSLGIFLEERQAASAVIDTRGGRRARERLRCDVHRESQPDRCHWASPSELACSIICSLCCVLSESSDIVILDCSPWTRSTTSVLAYRMTRDAGVDNVRQGDQRHS